MRNLSMAKLPGILEALQGSLKIYLKIDFIMAGISFVRFYFTGRG
jgi:hypothetical protein